MIATRSLIAMAALAVLTACSSDDPAPEPAAPPSARAATPAPAAAEKAAPDMARGVVSGKPAAGVDLYYEIQTRPSVGEPVDIEIRLVTQVVVDRLEASISAMDGLRILSPADPDFVETGLAAGDEVRRVVTFVPDTAGVFYASVLVKTDGETGVQARTFAIPLMAGEAAAAQKAAPAQTDASGERIRSMPAEESGG
jgi:hypothetical protein